MSIIEEGMQPLKPSKISCDHVLRIHFQFEHWGWMNVFLTELGPHCGELAIHSDWGTWAYTWNGMADGETLRTFLCKADCDYITNKLAPSGRNEKWDPEATKKAIAAHLEETYTENEEIALERWNHRRYATRAALLDLLEHCDWESGETLWIERMDNDLSAALGGEAWNFSVKGPSVEWTVLKHGLLPVLKDYLKKLNAKPTISAVP